MQQVIDFFKGLFETSLWPPRWHCGYWSDFHGWFYIISDLLIWSAYFAIPVIIISYISKRKELRFHKIYFLFAGFILACGTTHLIDAITFWYPFYRFNALIRFITAILSWVTVYSLFKIIPAAFSLKSSSELEAEVESRKQTEEKLRINNNHLVEAKKQLTIKTDELEIVNTELEKFAYVASHDLKEPLRKIKTYISRLKSEPATEFNYIARQGYENKIVDAADRMQNLIENILNFSHITSQTKIELTDLNIVLANTLLDIEVLVDSSKAKISSDILPTLMANMSQMEQLFMNLISNAIKFRKKVVLPEINISSKIFTGNDLLLHITNLTDEIPKKGFNINIKYCAIEFSDNGIGFESQNAEKIFEAFQRLESKSDYEGSGIGLAICKRIVENHKGYILPVSVPGVGTKFLVILPLMREE